MYLSTVRCPGCHRVTFVNCHDMSGLSGRTLVSLLPAPPASGIALPPLRRMKSSMVKVHSRTHAASGRHLGKVRIKTAGLIKPVFVCQLQGQPVKLRVPIGWHSDLYRIHGSGVTRITCTRLPCACGIPCSRATLNTFRPARRHVRNFRKSPCPAVCQNSAPLSTYLHQKTRKSVSLLPTTHFRIPGKAGHGAPTADGWYAGIPVEEMVGNYDP